MFKLDEKLMADNRSLITIQGSKDLIDNLVKNGTLNYVTDTNDLYLTIPTSKNNDEYNRLIQEESDGKIPNDLVFKGSLTIEKNLLVQGEQVTMNTSTVTIEDNIIEINKGETGAGISLGASGIQINRGTLGTANVLYDENQHAFVLDTNGIIRFWSYDNGDAKTLGNLDTQMLTANKAINGKSTMTIDGATSLKNTLSVLGATNLSSTLSVADSASFLSSITGTGAAWFKSTLKADGATTLGSTLTVSGISSLNNNVNISKILDVTGASNLHGAVSIDTSLNNIGTTTLNTLNTTGAVDLDSTLNVDGISTFNNVVNIKNQLNVDLATTLKSTLNTIGAVDFDSTLNVDGATTLRSTLNTLGATTLNSTLGVSGIATFSDNVNINKALSTTLNATVGTSLSVGTSATVGGTLGVTGSTDLNNTLSVKGGTILSSTLNVTGTTTLAGALIANNGVTVNSDTNLVKNITTGLGGNLTVGGIATFNGSSNFTGTAQFASILSTGNITTNSNLIVDGTTTLKKAVSINDSLSVLLNANIAGTLGVTGTTTLGTLNAGATNVSSTLKVTGVSTLGSLNAGATVLSSMTTTGLGKIGTTLEVVGATTLKSTLNGQGAVDFDSTLNVDGAATLNNTLTVGSNIWGKANLTIDGATTLNNTTTISGATTINNTLSATGKIHSDANYSLGSGNGKGYNFWNDDNNKIYMSSSVDATWGGRLDSTSDYNMYFKIYGGTNRGYVFSNGSLPIAQIEGNGNLRFTGDAYKKDNTVWRKILHEGMYGVGGNINADMVDNLHADTDYLGTPNELAVYDSNKRVYDSVRLQGATPATTAVANSIAKRDASGNLTIASLVSFANTKIKDASGIIEFKNSADNSYVWTAEKGITLNDNISSVKMKPESGALAIRNESDTDYADIIINNLIVKGQTTTVDSETITLADNTIVLNSNYVGSTPTENGGIELKRGTQINASLIWDETSDKWKAGLVGSEQNIVLTNDTRLSNLDSLGKIDYSNIKNILINAKDVVTDSTHRFATDTQIASWNSAAAGTAAGYLEANVESEQVVSGSEVRVQSTTTTAKYVFEFDETTGNLQIVYYS